MWLAKKNGGIKMVSLQYISKIAYRNIYRNIRRTALCIVAIAVAVFFIVVMMGLLTGMVGNGFDTIKLYETGDLNIVDREQKIKEGLKTVLYPIEFDSITADEFVDEIRKINNVKEVEKRISVYCTFKDSNVKNGVIWGINVEDEFKHKSFNLATRTNKLVEGRFPEMGANECAIGMSMAKKMGIGLGDKITYKMISNTLSDKFMAPEIVGIFDFDYYEVNKNYIIVPIDRLEKVLNLNDMAQSIIIYLKNEGELDKTRAEIEALVKKYDPDDNLLVRSWKENYLYSFMQIAIVSYGVIFAVFLIVASFLIVNTITMVIHERIKEIGMMGSLGMSRGEIVLTFFFEALFLSIIGALFGAILGGATTFILSFFPFNMARDFGTEMAGIGNTIFIKFSFLNTLISFLIGVVVSSLFTIFPSLRSAFIEPVEALRR